MFATKIDAFVSVQDLPSGEAWRYSLGRRSEYIPFPVGKIFETLNGVDPLVAGQNRWGGGNIIGGSPRATGSGLSPSQITELIDTVLKAKELKTLDPRP